MERCLNVSGPKQSIIDAFCFAWNVGHEAVYASPDVMYPCGAERYRYLPHGVMKVVKCRSDSASGTEW